MVLERSFVRSSTRDSSSPRACRTRRSASASLGEVAKGHDGALDVSERVANRRARVLDGKTVSVLSPEQFVVRVPCQMIRRDRVNRTRVFVANFAAGFGMTQHLVRQLSGQFLGRPADHAGRGGINESDASLQIQAVDAFAGGGENQFAPVARIGGGPLGFFRRLPQSGNHRAQT